jgi:hypothetical protein
LRTRKEQGIILKLDFKKAYDRVDWLFLEEVLKRRGFSEKWISWMRKVVQGGGGSGQKWSEGGVL